ncbi:MAG: CHRD domain-containing protein [Thermoleophilia bacterium]|nr:CHRD domain-containing protein [Thermoleophilia bacterium]
MSPGAKGKAWTFALALVVGTFLAGCTLLPKATTVAPATTTTPTTTTSKIATTTIPPPTTTVTVTFTAELSGKEVVPPVETIATGTATFTFESALDRAYFVLKVSNLDGATASRLKEGKPGTNGQGVLILYPGPGIVGPVTGVLAQGYFNASALIGSLKGKTIADLKVLLETGGVYVNVGTVKNPNGEIRGQVK